VRLEWYLKLIYKYEYEPENIDLEVEMPKRVPNQLADLVIYEEKSLNPYFVIEFKKANITDNEFDQAVKQ
jgi:type I restriction enzyme M protein